MKNKFIFSFKSVVIFVFCFVLLGSFVLLSSLSKKASGLDVSEPVGGWPEETPPAEEPPSGNGSNGLIEAEDISNLQGMDQGSEPDPDNTSIGTTFTGPSGTTYVLQEENLSEQEIQDLANLGFSPAGVWVPVSTPNGDGNGDRYSCSGAPNYTCYTDSNGAYSSLAACQSSCKPSTITPTVDPSQAQYRCMQCRCH